MRRSRQIGLRSVRLIAGTGLTAALLFAAPAMASADEDRGALAADEADPRAGNGEHRPDASGRTTPQLASGSARAEQHHRLGHARASAGRDAGPHGDVSLGPATTITKPGTEAATDVALDRAAVSEPLEAPTDPVAPLPADAPSADVDSPAAPASGTLGGAPVPPRPVPAVTSGTGTGLRSVDDAVGAVLIAARIAPADPVPIGDVSAAGGFVEPIGVLEQLRPSDPTASAPVGGLPLDPLVPVSLGLLLLARAMRQRPTGDDRSYRL